MCENNWVKDNRDIIRQKFWFRVVALLVSTGIIIVIDSSSAIGGVAISIAAWAIVELWNYVVDINSKYIKERVLFFDGLISLMSDLVQEFRKIEVEQTNRDGFYRVDDIMRGDNKERLQEIIDVWERVGNHLSKINKYLFKSTKAVPVYSCSKEFDKIANYMNRCFWHYQASVYCKDYQDLYLTFFEHRPFSRSLDIHEFVEILNSQFNSVNKNYHIMKNIKLNDEPYEPPEGIVFPYHLGIVNEYSLVSSRNGQQEEMGGVVQFVPCKRLEHIVMAKKSDIPRIEMLNIISLMYPDKFSLFQLHPEYWY